MKKHVVQNLTVAFIFIFLSMNINAQITVEQDIYNKGIENFYKKNYYQAIDDFNILINSNKTDYLLISYLYRATSKNELSKYAEAISDFTTALVKFPNNPDLLNGRAWTYCFAGNYNLALSDINKALSISKVGAYYDTRATVYALMRSYTSAISNFNECLKLDKKPVYYYKRGLVKKANMDYSGADNDFATAKALDATESYNKLKDPLFDVFVNKTYSQENPKNKPGTITITLTPMALSISKYKQSFGNWCINFPAKPEIISTSGNNMTINFTANYKSGEWLYMVQYIVIDIDFYKRNLYKDYLNDIRTQYAKKINGILGQINSETNRDFDRMYFYTMTYGNGEYAYIKEGIIDNKIVKIILFNSRRCPTSAEFNEFYSTFSKSY